MASEHSKTRSQSTAYIIAGSQQLVDRGVRPGDSLSAAQQAIAAAEQAIEDLSVNFREWMVIEVRRLESAHRSARSDGLEPRALEAVYQVAHDLKGQAGTLGYPLAGEVCGSLCTLLEACADTGRIPVILLDQHVGAVKAMLREEATGESNATARELSGRLRAVTDDFIARQPAEGAA